MKKFFIITSVLFSIFLLFFLIYNFLFKNNPFEGRIPNVAIISNDTKTKEEENDKKELSEKKIAPLTEEAGTALAFDPKEEALLYLAPDEQALKAIFVVTNAPKTITTFPFVPKNIVWSGDMTRALVKKTDTEWALFVRGVRANDDSPLQMLKPGIESPAWTHLGDRIVYKYYDPSTKTRTLNIANPDGTDWSVVGETPFQFLEIRAIPKSSMMAFWNWGNAFEETSLKAISSVGGEAKEIFSKNYGADYVFAPDGEKILMSNMIEKGGANITLALINRNGGNYQNLFIPTIAGKAVWSKGSRVIYYALPGGIPAGSVLPNDYYRNPILTADTFWKVDTETGEKSRIADTNDIDKSYDAEFLTLDADETMLFFRNRRDGRIYRINL